MKIAFGMIVFNGNYVLKETLESVYPFANQILISEGPVKYWQSQGYKTSTDGTNDILHEFPDPENKIKIVHGQWGEKDEQCNAYVKNLTDDNDYIWNLDCDEVFKPQDIETLIKVLEKEKFTSVGFKSLSFYGGFDKYLGGFEEGAEFMRIRKIYPGSRWATHRPPTIVHPQGINRLPEKHLNYNTLAKQLGIRMYHYSYVFPKQVQEKVQYYKACVSKDNCIDNYFDTIYRPWVKGSHEVREQIENQWKGVHEFKPNFRGGCFTQQFKGEHPLVIQNNMTELQEKFDNQVKEIC